MTKCIDDLKVAFVTLAKNPILRYSEEISQHSLETLEVRIPAAYDAIKDKKAREILILSGFYDSSYKSNSPKGNLELQLSNDARNDMVRFRDIFIGNQYFDRHSVPVHNEWKFDEKSVNTSAFDNLNPSEISRFINSCFLFTTLCDNGRSAWKEIAEDYEDKFVRLGNRTRQAFINICVRVLEGNLKENEKRIHELLP